ncbi:MAG: hypothetical protein ACRDGN_12945 [bacterium]
MLPVEVLHGVNLRSARGWTARPSVYALKAGVPGKHRTLSTRLSGVSGTGRGVDLVLPAKLLVEINPQQLRNYRTLTRGAAYTVPNPSLRVRLDCT